MIRGVGKLGIALFGLVVALLVAEVGLRLAGPRLASPRLPLSYSLESIDQLASGQFQLRFDRELGWSTTPSVTRTQAGGPVFRHNRAGMRADREYSRTPSSGIRRFLAYGDSFTYCATVELSECWTDRLGRILGSSEVLNFGVPGYAPDQAWLRYQRDGSAWQPCAVLIGHMLENVNREVNRFRPFYDPETQMAMGKPRFVLEDGRPVLLPSPVERPEDLKDPLWVETNLGPQDAWYFPGTFVANPFDWLETVRLARTALYRRGHDAGVQWTKDWADRSYRPGHEEFEVALAILEQFAAQVRADGATPVVLIFPTKVEIALERDGAPRPHAAFLEALEQRAISTIDLTSALGREARRSALEDLVREHYRPAGNAVVARTLAEQLPRLTEPTCGH